MESGPWGVTYGEELCPAEEMAVGLQAEGTLPVTSIETVIPGTLAVLFWRRGDVSGTR